MRDPLGERFGEGVYINFICLCIKIEKYIYTLKYVYTQIYFVVMSRLRGSKNKKDKILKRVILPFSIYRLNISYLSGYGTFPTVGKTLQRDKCVSTGLDNLKARVLDQVLRNQDSRGLRYYSIAWQTHQSTGQPHLDILLIYDKIVRKSPSSFNYLLSLCPQRQSQTTPGVFVTGYSKTRLNKAILQYGTKEDPEPLSNLPEDLTSFLDIRKLQRDPYAYLDDQMSKDPLHFNLQQYVRKNNLAKYIKGWSGIKTKLRDMQVAAANLLLKARPGFKLITRQLIQQRLSPSQLTLFNSWSGYQKIVDKLNEIIEYRWNRPFKTKQLLLVGRPNTGKTSLVRAIEEYCSTYHLDVSNWFPNYKDGVYSLCFWDQFKLKGGFSYTNLLKFLQGSPMDLQYKGGSALRKDNQLIIMTSNMTLKQHLSCKFKNKDFQKKIAELNLRSRIDQILIPKKYTLFLLQNLLIYKE